MRNAVIIKHMVLRYFMCVVCCVGVDCTHNSVDFHFVVIMGFFRNSLGR